MSEISVPQCRCGFIVLELEGEDEALRIAWKIAEATGRAVRVRDDKLEQIAIVPAPTRN